MRGFISLTAHPDGCAAQVREQIAVAKASVRGGGPGNGLGNALVVGSSTGYGLASLLSVCFGYGAATLGVCLEKPSEEERVGSAGWYNLAEAHRLAAAEGIQLETINSDAFDPQVKQQVVETLRARFGKLDTFIYSLAAPRRQGPDGSWSSVLKPIGEPYSGKTIDLRKHEVTEAHIEPASDEEITDTVKVMGGEDWTDWVRVLQDAELLAEGCRTVAYSYVGPDVTRAIYRFGTIGRAKQDLERTAADLRAQLAPLGGGAWVSINKAVVTQASAAIPGVALYMSILFKIMKAEGTHEGPIEQIGRLFRDHIGPGMEPLTDDDGRIRLDDLEMRPEVQAAVTEAWNAITTENVDALSDYAGYRHYFEQLFGFGVAGVDYAASTEVQRALV